MILCALASLAVFVAPQAPKSTPPPGMVLIPGGMTWIGTERAEVEKAAEDSVARFNNLANETPQFQRNVESFFLGITEVTNEQFEQFVRAAGSRPPDSWGMKAIDEASAAYALEVGTKRNEARAAGKPPPDLPGFDQVQWWNDHWQTAAWEVPKGQETLPAGYIDYFEAEAYARWAGVRLMSEFEFQRAARGSTKNDYPWGDKWDPAMCANGGLGLKGAKPVGSYPGGKTPQGVFDLSGNVWEWTSSPFVEYPGFKVIHLRRKTETIDGLVAWNANQRVVVSGSYATESPSAARVSTRRPTEPSQSAEAMGFRIAASQSVGTDISGAILRRAAQQLPADVKYDENKSIVCDRWRTLPGKSEVPGYSVIAGYDFVSFVPAVGLDFTSLGQLELASLDKGPVHVGVIATNKALLSPTLPAGTYAIAWRGPGPLREHESIHSAAAAPPGAKQESRARSVRPVPAAEGVEYPEGFKPEKRNLLFYDKDRRIVGALHIEAAEFVVPIHTAVEIGTTKVEVVADGKPSEVEASSVILHVNTWVKVTNKGLGYAIPLAFAAGEVTPEWRH